MSRWAALFAALSGGPDTIDTMRHSAEPNPAVSQSVQSVTPPAARASGLQRELRVAGDDAKGSLAEGTKTTDGSILGSNIDLVSDDEARKRTSLTLLTQLTQWAEGIARLDPDQPLGDVPLGRWQKFITDARRLIDDGIVAQAAAAGWSAHDLFGCDATKPFARLDQAGLAWFVKGARVVSTSMSAAVIETPTGARQTYRRKDSAAGRVLVWELE